jgi:hypothetical protein|nr:MAG TPA: hypothetical protein [Caudoviricetes sp.]DAJ15514.1 MAG TPA: hypothetical protein [Siphoviridae sp. ctuHV12]DAK18460.1 MAG TPA: hypothetical protein [Caudoviricetes sp.]
MEKSKEIGLAITEIQVKVLTQSESLSAYELNNIKIKARTLYESLVWLHYEAEERKY